MHNIIFNTERTS